MVRGTRALCIALIVSMAGWAIAAQGFASMPNTRIPKSLCVGRFILDLPTDAKSDLDATYHYIDERTPRRAASFDSIKSAIESDRKKYSYAQMDRSERSDAIYRSGGVDPDKIYGKNQLIIFHSSDKEEQIIIGYHPRLNSPQAITEVHRYLDGKDYVFKSEGAGADDVNSTRDMMWAAVAHFRPIVHGIIPSTPGFCVEGGMFADDGRPPVHESFTLVVHFKDRPDAQFSIDAHAIDRVNTDEPSLRHRVGSELSMLRENVDGHVDVLVRGDYKAAGQDGYQIGLSVPSDVVQGAKIYKFFWAADGVPNDVTRPYMEVDLTIQPTENQPATVTDAKEAQALWAQLLDGIRIRPGAVTSR